MPSQVERARRRAADKRSSLRTGAFLSQVKEMLEPENSLARKDNKSLAVLILKAPCRGGR